MKIEKNLCRVALVQAEPALFDKAFCVDKALMDQKAAAAEE